MTESLRDHRRLFPTRFPASLIWRLLPTARKGCCLTEPTRSPFCCPWGGREGGRLQQGRPLHPLPGEEALQVPASGGVGAVGADRPTLKEEAAGNDPWAWLLFAQRAGTSWSLPSPPSCLACLPPPCQCWKTPLSSLGPAAQPRDRHGWVAPGDTPGVHCAGLLSSSLSPGDLLAILFGTLFGVTAIAFLLYVHKHRDQHQR